VIFVNLRILHKNNKSTFFRFSEIRPSNIDAPQKTKFDFVLALVTALKHFPRFSSLPRRGIFMAANNRNGFERMA
jgi:hypothetical protein